MAPPKLHVLFCLCSCLVLVHPFDWQHLNPTGFIKSSGWTDQIRMLMASVSFEHSKIPRGSGSYSVGCTDLMFDYTNKVQHRAKECSQALNVILDIAHGRPVKDVLNLGFDVQQLKGSIDRNKIAVIGHSFGGATVFQALSEDQRFRCGIALDPWMYPVSDDVYSKIPQPLFFINSERFQSPNDIIKMTKFYLPDKERKMITIKGSVHHNFADFTFAAGKIIGHIFKFKGHIDSGVAIDLIDKASLAFLQKYLGLHKDFDQWDPLMEGDDENLIPGPKIHTPTQLDTPQNSMGIEKMNVN
ncbi:Platelet-activating factor acetylhydrolase [Sciurus carolinensis]|uniref:1-alkyl-2-acetylglycerophosphocholine esterase n=1 Tax=Sciurus carolinensis TaxID=30640 RepID=A0AA41SR65_SCICA|nr:Platelet-activating factor acetylhydrolase [Sciurus carolinensis]